MFGLVPVFYCTYFKIPSLEWSVKSRFPVLDCIGTPFACMDCIEAPWAYVQKPCDWNVWDTLCLVCFGTPSSWNFLGHLLLEMFWDTLCIPCLEPGSDRWHMSAWPTENNLHPFSKPHSLSFGVGQNVVHIRVSSFQLSTSSHSFIVSFL